MKWCLDMPCLTDVYLTEKAFKHIKFVTIIGGTHFIPLSWIDIGALQRHLRGGKRRYHLTIRVWNDGNPIWIMETRSSDCFPPYRSKCTLFSIPNHPRRIPIPMRTIAKSLFSTRIWFKPVYSLYYSFSFQSNSIYVYRSCSSLHRPHR